MIVNIRPEREQDLAAIHHVHNTAFGGNIEADLVDALRRDNQVTLSLVAEVDGRVVGHILFSTVQIVAAKYGRVEALSLAPMAVLPNYQRRGIGSRLVEEGLAACRQAGHRIVVVLGHPQYYPRFGFSAERARPLTCPFGSGDVWMALELVPGALHQISGVVEYPPAFDACE